MPGILIIDDNETMREGMAATIRRMGHEARVAGSGAEGLALMRKHAPDFLITDLKMEGVGGLEVLEAAKRRSPSPPRSSGSRSNGRWRFAVSAKRGNGPRRRWRPCGRTPPWAMAAGRWSASPPS
jgi:CheY-like chemotaxis protein